MERGLKVKPWVKTSLAPGSKVVIDYYQQGRPAAVSRSSSSFHLVGFGCTTCIGNSGPLPEPVAQAVQKENLVVAAVLSGNRNFEGRINPQVKANYLASPPLVVAYALAGTMDIDLAHDPLGQDSAGTAGLPARHLALQRGSAARPCAQPSTRKCSAHEYAQAFDGDANWQAMPVPDRQHLPVGRAVHLHQEAALLRRTWWTRRRRFTTWPACACWRCWAIRSPPTTSRRPARFPRTARPGRYLIAQGVQPTDFNSYGARRGNHEVMVRGTLANIRLRNQLAPGTEGGWTVHLPDGEQMYIYDASMLYQQEGVPLLILAGKEYGSGSSRDWAAKGVMLLGVRAVIAESFERIHRTNLVGMGVLPLQFEAGESAAGLELTGKEMFPIEGVRPRSTAAAGRPRCARLRRMAPRRDSRWTFGWIRRRRWNTTATAAFCRTCCGNWPDSAPGDG